MAKHKGRLIKNAIQDMESVMRPEVVDQVNREVEKQLSHTRQTTSAQSAEQREEDFAPAVDPITGAPLFMWIDHPERGMVPTYGGPFDSYTLCERDIDESNSDEIRFYRERFDHDEGAWVEGCESVEFSLITQTRLISLEDSRGRAMSAFERLADEAGGKD